MESSIAVSSGLLLLLTLFMAAWNCSCCTRQLDFGFFLKYQLKLKCWQNRRCCSAASFRLKASYICSLVSHLFRVKRLSFLRGCFASSFMMRNSFRRELALAESASNPLFRGCLTLVGKLNKVNVVQCLLQGYPLSCLMVLVALRHLLRIVARLTRR